MNLSAKLNLQSSAVRRWLGCGTIVLVAVLLVAKGLTARAQAPAVAATAMFPKPVLVWEPISQNYTATQNAVGARFTFRVKNTSTNTVVINDVKTSCECTIAGIPEKPWRLAPSETNKLEAVVDLRDRMRTVTSSDIILKQIYVLGATETNILTITITIPPGLTNTLTPHNVDRIWGQELAAVDHQAVFKDKCVQCHLVPAFGKTGERLYLTACGICHDASPRADMVPDLHQLKTTIDTNYWRTWISFGKAGTLMPGFLNSQGGPLEDAQVASLVAYMTNAFPRPMKAMGTNSPH